MALIKLSNFTGIGRLPCHATGLQQKISLHHDLRRSSTFVTEGITRHTSFVRYVLLAFGHVCLRACSALLCWPLALTLEGREERSAWIADQKPPPQLDQATCFLHPPVCEHSNPVQLQPTSESNTATGIYIYGVYKDWTVHVRVVSRVRSGNETQNAVRSGHFVPPPPPPHTVNSTQ